MRVWADFNGVFGDILCLSHRDTCTTDHGDLIHLSPGMILTAYMEDSDENGNRNDLVASGVVERSPAWLACNDSKWVLRIDEKGIKHESDMRTQ
jgi:hypothetical protein